MTIFLEAVIAIFVVDSEGTPHLLDDLASARVRRFRRSGVDGAEADCLLGGQVDVVGKVELPTEVIVGAREGIGILQTPCVLHIRRVSRWGEVQEREGPGPLACLASGLPITWFAGQNDLDRGVGPEDGRDALGRGALLSLIFLGLVLHTHFEGHSVVDLDGRWIDSRARLVTARFDGRGE